MIWIFIQTTSHYQQYQFHPRNEITRMGILLSALWTELWLNLTISMAWCKTAVTPLLTHWSYCSLAPWWRHQMETFSALLALCAENSQVTGEFRSQMPVTRSFEVFFDQHLNTRLSKQYRGYWFEMQLSSLWRHRIDWGIYFTHKIAA